MKLKSSILAAGFFLASSQAMADQQNDLTSKASEAGEAALREAIDNRHFAEKSIKAEEARLNAIRNEEEARLNAIRNEEENLRRAAKARRAAFQEEADLLRENPVAARAVERALQENYSLLGSRIVKYGQAGGISAIASGVFILTGLAGKPGDLSYSLATNFSAMSVGTAIGCFLSLAPFKKVKEKAAEKLNRGGSRP